MRFFRCVARVSELLWEVVNNAKQKLFIPYFVTAHCHRQLSDILKPQETQDMKFVLIIQGAQTEYIRNISKRY